MFTMIWSANRAEANGRGLDMRYFLAVSAAALLVACGESELVTATPEPAKSTTEVSTGDPAEPASPPETDSATMTYNEETWYISPGWPGEYPSGFSVLDENVTLMGRSVMHDDAEQTIACPVPQNATYQLWNSARVESENVEFVTVSEKVEITISADVIIDAPTDEDFENKLNLKSGDMLTYLRYIGEGWAVMEHDFAEYQIQEGALNGVSDVDTVFEGTAKDYLWAQITCADDGKTRAWLLFDEVIKTEGMVLTPITGYGDARDMTEEDRTNAVEQMKFYLEEEARASEETGEN